MIDNIGTISGSGRLMRTIDAVVERIASDGVESSNESFKRQRRTLLAFWLIGALPWPLVFALVYQVLLDCTPGCLICLAAFFSLLPIPRLSRTERGRCFAANWLIAVMIASLIGLACFTGGAGAPALTWILPVPLVAVYATGIRPAIAWCAVALAVLLAFDVLDRFEIEPYQALSHDSFRLLASIANLAVVLLVGTLAFTYEAQRSAAMRLADQQQSRLERALARAEVQATQLAEANDALRTSEALYRSLVQNSPMGMYFCTLTDEDSLVLADANPAADRLIGVDSRQLLGLPIEAAFPALRGTQVLERYRAAAADGIPWSEEQLTYDDGSVSGIFDVRAFQTAPRKMVAVFMNITSRVKAEAAVRASEREIALQAGKAEVATHVLHNVGNVLSRVKVSSTVLRERVLASETPTVERVARLIREHEGNLPKFLCDDERGRTLPAFLQSLAEVLAAEQAQIGAELEGMAEAIEHIGLVISMQQVHSHGGTLVETVRPGDIVEQALGISISGRQAPGVEIVRELEEIGAVRLQRHKILQILVNLLRNAVHAVSQQRPQHPQIICRAARAASASGDILRFSVEDNGVGIDPAHVPQLFLFGFTTRKDGHGFGLHSSASLAQEMGGALRVASEGLGRGAIFTLELPLSPEGVRV